VLRGVADILAHELRESDLVGRTGGDEFAACLVHSDVDVGPLFIPRLRSRVAELSGEPGMPPVLSIGAGCAHFPTEAGNAEALFELADARLYEAKRARNA
jgi:diguanylate cyclase (GGDEF)-like protein